MNQSELQKRFDEIFHKAVPLVLFSTVNDRKEYGDFLSSLFIMCCNGNVTAFNEVYDLLVNKLNNKTTFDRHQQEYIDAFHNRYLSFNERIENIEKTYLDFQSLIKQINNDHQNVLDHGRSLNRVHKKINSINILLPSKKLNKKIGEDVAVKEVKPKSTVCPICDTKLYQRKEKAKNKISFYCKKGGNKYFHWFRLKDNGEFYYCKKCGSVLLGTGKSLWCSNDKCSYKEKVV